MTTRKQVLTVNAHAKHYLIVRRNCAAWEPSFCVVVEGSGSSADAVSHFFNQDTAEEYVEFKNRKKGVA